MKKNLRRLYLLALLTAFIGCTHAADTNGFQVTIELQDGSNLVGKAGDDSYRFHSEILGDLNLPLAKIRAIECQPKTNSVKLATPDGDTLQAHFLMAEIRVTTTYGKVKLPTNLLKKIQIVAAGQATPMLPGLVALWSAEGNGNDAIGGNHATLTDVSFAAGEVGQAFSLNGFSSYLKVPTSSALDVGEGNGLTIAAWIKPQSDNQNGPIVEWDSYNDDGVQLWECGGGTLYANLKDTSGSIHQIKSATGLLVANKFQHVAVTYDKSVGLAVIYINGVEVSSENLGIFAPQTTYPINIGKRTGQPTGLNTTFSGLLDEIAIYNRALSAAEIRAIGAR